MNRKSAGFLGELHPQWVQAYELNSAPVLFELDIQSIVDFNLPSYKDVSKLPVVIRDLALVVDRNVQAGELKKALMDLKDDNLSWLKSVILFDEFVPKEEGKGLKENEKSLAFRLTLQASDRSLTDADVEPLLKKMLSAAEAKCGARLR